MIRPPQVIVVAKLPLRPMHPARNYTVARPGVSDEYFTQPVSRERCKILANDTFGSCLVGADERRAERTNVILTAILEIADKPVIHVRISNLSASGALLIGPDFPPTETAAVLRCNDLALSGWITWSDGHKAGMQFSDPIETEALTKRARRVPAAILKDERSLDFKRPGFRGNQMSDAERDEVERWLRDQTSNSPQKP